MGCKCVSISDSHFLTTRFNRNIMGCKFCYVFCVFIVCTGFNRNIMGCKLITDTKVENGDTDLIGT